MTVLVCGLGASDALAPSSILGASEPEQPFASSWPFGHVLGSAAPNSLARVQKGCAPQVRQHKGEHTTLCVGNQHPPPNEKSLCNFEVLCWLADATHHVMPKVRVLKTSHWSRHVLVPEVVWLFSFWARSLRPRQVTSRDGFQQHSPISPPCGQ